MKMAHPIQTDGPLVKRQKVGAPSNSASATAASTSRGSRIFAPFRVGIPHFQPWSRKTNLELIFISVY